MTRGEVFVIMLLGFVAVIAGATWILGPLALVGAGLALAVFGLVVNMKE